MLEMFYCGLCTYSSTSKAHLGVHAYFTHDAKPVPWYKNNSDAKPVLPPEEFKNLVHRKRYFCTLTTTCHFSCLTNDIFRGHLESHKDFSTYKCHLCFGSTDTSGLLFHHYQTDHGFFAVQCLYCDFGSNDDWIVIRHVMEQHSRRPFRILLRNGDTPAVSRELRLLMQEYLTEDPVMPAQPCAQLSVEALTQKNVTSSNEAMSGVDPAQPCAQLSLEALTQVHVTSSNAAIPRADPVNLGHSSLEAKLSLDHSCKGVSNMDSEVEEKLVENDAANSAVCVTHQSAGRTPPLSTEESLYSSSNECTQCLATQLWGTKSLHPSYHVQQNMELEPGKAQPLHETETSSSLNDSWHLRCSAENCSVEFRDIFDYLNHLAECHPLQSSFPCPKCDLTVSSPDLSMHLVEKHSGFLFCPYQDCSFGSPDQCGLDTHIIQAHQIYREENRNGALAASEQGLCTTSNSSSKNHTSTRNVDFTSEMEIPNGESRDVKLCCEVSLENAKDDPTNRLYICGSCSTNYSTLTCYLHHIASAHSVPFICGHCFKPYKRSRCLLMHAGCLHLGQPFSVLCLKDGKETDIGLNVAPLWIEEAQEYLRMVHPGKMQAKGKTMLKNLKRAVTYISSACLENVSSQTELLQTNAVSHSASLRLVHGAEGTSLQYERTVDTVRSDATVSSGRSIPSQLLYDPAPVGVVCNGSSNSSENQLTVVPHLFKNLDLSLVDTSPPHLQNASSSMSQFTIARNVKWKILTSVYIDASSIKKVNGNIVVDSGVLQKLRRLNSQLPMSSPPVRKVSGSLCCRVNEGLHVCSECFLTFSTFEELAKHIVKLHSLDITNGFDLASAVLSIGDSSGLQGLTFQHDIKQSRDTAQLQLKPVQSEVQKRVVDNRRLFVCLHNRSVKVPYSQFSRAVNLNPIVKLVRVPMIKKEPKE
ncbi:uncharacterized protein LOC144121143 isoform X1 [Amblyomma americanum]